MATAKEMKAANARRARDLRARRKEEGWKQVYLNPEEVRLFELYGSIETLQEYYMDRSLELADLRKRVEELEAQLAQAAKPKPRTRRKAATENG